ncbi:MAG: hypothetical protein JSU00_10315 [Acidobacteria bacterium]|nr:hypothetical protein [Acidobacteriota bacterium]
MVARVSGKPIPNLQHLFGAAVVRDDVHVHIIWKALFFIEKAQEFLVAVAPMAGTDRHSGGYVHGGKQRNDAMALVIVSLTGGNPGRQRRDRLGPVQSLNLALLIDAQQRPVRMPKYAALRVLPQRISLSGHISVAPQR